MSYIDRETGDHSAAPIECYKFTGSFQNYHYTSAAHEITLAGERYIPAAAKRNGIRSGTQEDTQLALEISMPFDLDVVRDYAYAESPFSLFLEVFRTHEGADYNSEYVLYWAGSVASFSVTGRTAKVSVPSMFGRALGNSVPNVYYQNTCNHALYDGKCRVSKGAFTTNAEVIVVGTKTFTVDEDGCDDDALKAGEAVVERNGERRMIVGNNTNSIEINYPFVDLRVGDVVALSQGCDHSYTTCEQKFANTKNFGGQPFIPGDNPFEGEL